MGARMLVTRRERSTLGRWTTTSGRPPVLFLLLVLLLLLAAVVVGPVAGATGIRGPEEICLGTGGPGASPSLFPGVAGGAR